MEPGGQERFYEVLKALEEFFTQQGVVFDSETLYEVFTALQTKWQAAGQPVMVDGKIARSFLTAVYTGITTAPGEAGLAGGDFGTPPPIPPSGTVTPPADIRAGFLAYLTAYGIGLTPNLQQLVQQATDKSYSLDRFLLYLRQTPEYQDRFTGIFNADGSMRMSESQYLSNEFQYESYAAQYGIDWTPGLKDWLFTNSVSPSEFAARAPAYTQLRANPDLYKQFGKALVQQGAAGKGDVTQESLLRFIMGEGNQEWYDVWNLARARYVAVQSGIQLKRGSDRYLALNPRLVEHIANLGLSDQGLAAGYAELAQNLLTTLPLSRLQHYNLTKKELEQAAFGGKHSAEIQRKIEHVQAQEQAFYGDRAEMGLVQGAQGGLGIAGREQRPQE